MKSKYFYLKALILLMPAIMLVFISSFSAVAADGLPDLSKKGSISVTLKADEKAVSGAEITLYQAAEVYAEDGNLSFKATADFSDFDISSASAESLADCAKNKNLTGLSAETDSNGGVKFENLPLGMYLAVQTGSAKGFSDCTPFIVTVPTEQEGKWVYDNDASPKTDITRLVDITVKKVWNDNREDRPKSISVQLFKGESALETVTLREENGWSYKWTDMEKSDDYSVKEAVPDGYTATYSAKDFDFTITNTAPLIQTGQLNWPVPVLTAAGILLFAVGFILYHKRKNNRA